MEQPEVTPQGAQPSGAGDKPQGGSGKAADEKVTLSRAEFEALRRETAEAKESERYWAGVARRGGAPVTETAEETEEQIETSDLIPEVTGDQAVDDAIFNDPDKWAEAISKGPAAIKAFIKTQGLVTAQEAAEIAAKVAQRTVQVERQKITADNVIVRDFPDLTNQNSDLFKATAVELKKLVAMDPRAKNSPATLYAAARVAKAGLDAKAATDRRTRDPEAEDDRYDRFDHEPEEERRRRADSQDGSRTRAHSASDDEDMLGPEAKEVMRQMNITQEEFLASAKQVRGERPRGRR